VIFNFSTKRFFELLSYVCLVQCTIQNNKSGIFFDMPSIQRKMAMTRRTSKIACLGLKHRAFSHVRIFRSICAQAVKFILSLRLAYRHVSIKGVCSVDNDDSFDKFCHSQLNELELKIEIQPEPALVKHPVFYFEGITDWK